MSGDAGGGNKPNVCFVLGVPGAGKGTQCDLIRKHFGYVHLSAGDLLRKEMKPAGEGEEVSELGKKIAGHIKQGSIVPVAITVKLLWNAMQEHIREQKCNFLIDGFPRNEDNMTGWNDLMADKANVKMVLFFDCPAEIGVERCLKRGQAGSGRSDDNPESLRKRIDTYKNDSLPIIERYREMGLVKQIRAEQTTEEVFAEVQKLFS